MKCPACPESTLVLSERQGIEIDYCPACRGVWLDRGELDKIIERAGPVQDSYRESAPPPPPQQRPMQGSHKYHSKYHTAPYGKRKKAKSFLGDLFEF